MDENFYNETFDIFNSAWGEESQYRICIEEMSELTKELCKYIRYSKNLPSEENDKKLAKIKENIIEETADVLICASQIKRLIGDKEVEKMMEYKIKRGRKKVDDYIENLNKGGNNGQQ